MEARYLTDLEWRICHAVNIYVFRNGREGEQPVLVHIPPAKKKNMRTLMNVIQERVKYPVGYAKFLYKMDGSRVRDPCELEMYNNYVVATNFEKHFKCAAYGRKRSPLLVLNRESKHVRVLRLQNQNYYEWLLKKKAVGEERPPYIYPTYYTDENHKPQDLPVGQMGNYHPPPVTCGGNQQYTVNAVTVEVPQKFGNVDLSGGLLNVQKRADKHNVRKNAKMGGKIMEPTPSDMLNANTVVTTDETSQEKLTAVTSEADERINKLRKAQGNNKSKVHRPRVVTSEEYNKSLPESVTYSSEVLKKHHHHHTSRKSKRRKEKEGKSSLSEVSVPPPPPSQFRDNAGLFNTMQSTKSKAHNYQEKNIIDPNGNVVQSGMKTFFYSPEKLPGMNSTTHIPSFEYSGGQQQLHGNGNWAFVHPAHQQHLYAGISQGMPSPAMYQAHPVEPSTATYPPHSQYSNVMNSYPPMQSHAMQQLPTSGLRQMQVSQQGVPFVFNSSQNGTQPTQCLIFPSPSSHQNPQLVTIQSPSSQSHLQQVYQLGIVQQPNPQTCIQVDAKQMRQYVDNQKLIESRFGNGGQYLTRNNNNLRNQYKRYNHDDLSTAPTESEVDIPFTPLKTYRLHPSISSTTESRSTKSGKRLLPKVKSRNVAIQMGYPGATVGVGNNLFSRPSPASELSVLHDRRMRKPQQDLPDTALSPKKGMESILLPKSNTARNNHKPNIHPTYSDQYISLCSGRNSFGQKREDLRSGRSTRTDPGLEDLVTIPPPTEFREAQSFPMRHQRNQQFHFSNSSDHLNNNKYSYRNNNNDRLNMQYIYSNNTDH